MMANDGSYLVGGDWNMTLIFPYIGNNHPNGLIFVRRVASFSHLQLLEFQGGTRHSTRGLQILTRELSFALPEERPSWRLDDGTVVAERAVIAVGYVGCVAECYALTAAIPRAQGLVLGEGSIC